MPDEKYVPLAGSDSSPRVGAQRAGPADPARQMFVTLMLRPKNKLPDLTGQSVPVQLSHEDFAASYGADPGEIAKVEEFARNNHLSVVAKDSAQRTVKLSGSAANFSKALRVELHDYQYAGGTYRGYEGAINLPESLVGIVEGVFGLDDRPAAQPR